jgi:ferredoxin-NADP reductase
VCGSPAMVEATIKRLISSGVPEKRIRFEEFGEA